jgi:colanic acid/amylovoran biosynthesis glycosyltransferase
VNIAYLMNAYPMTSTTFIRREIEALEELGLKIQRHAVRTWAEDLVDQRDIAERVRTHYLLTDNILGLLFALVKEPFINPRGLARSLWIWAKLLRNSRYEFVKHMAYLMQAVYFRQLAEERRFTHVHVHFATNATAVALLSRLMGGPSYSFTVHGPDEFVEPERLSFGTKIEHAAFVVAISEYCRSQLLRFARDTDGCKIVVGRCALALEEFEGATEASSNKVLVCVGRLCPQKGQVLIPAAVAQLREEFPDVKVVLIGDGESRVEVERAIAAYKVADLVELRGWVANGDVLRLIRESRALLLPSYAEGLPVVIMEALASGRPVISTLIAGIPELVDETCGWLFPAGNEQKLLEAMRGALTCTPSVLAKMGEAGQERVKRFHDRRRLAKLLYENFLEHDAPN